MTLLSIALVMSLYICVALCAMWAWQQGDWWLAVPLTIIFLAATFGMVWYFERWGVA
jgi:hypothetical protein